MSTDPRKTAAVAITWHSDQARITDIRHPLRLVDIAHLIVGTPGTRWAVDVPFGWPDRFVDLMLTRHTACLPATAIPADAEWETWRTKQVAQRRTDTFLTAHPDIKTRPLPASFQLLGATAAAWTLIDARLADRGVRIDRAGLDGRVIETYPAAALKAWATGVTGKVDWARLQGLFEFLVSDDEIASKLSSDDVCDAVICALVARARDLGLTQLPADGEELEAARREGWIHVHLGDPRRLLG
jgi:hypothetical protein